MAKKTAWQQLQEFCPIKKCYFVRWYCLDEEDREDFAEYSKRFMGGVELSTAMDYLFEEDVQRAIKFWMKQMETQRLMKIYNKQYKQALEGDVQSAKFIMDFGKSGFFNEKENELEQLLHGIKVDK